MTNLYTKSQIARLLKVDIRSKAIKSLEPVTVAHMGSKAVELYEAPQN